MRVFGDCITVVMLCFFSGGFQGGFNQYHGNIDPEELFRKIFGDAGFNMPGGFGMNDFAESNFGFAAASEVRTPDIVFLCTGHIFPIITSGL